LPAPAGRRLSQKAERAGSAPSREAPPSSRRRATAKPGLGESAPAQATARRAAWVRPCRPAGTVGVKSSSSRACGPSSASAGQESCVAGDRPVSSLPATARCSPAPCRAGVPKRLRIQACAKRVRWRIPSLSGRPDLRRRSRSNFGGFWSRRHRQRIRGAGATEAIGPSRAHGRRDGIASAVPFPEVLTTSEI
jgi:hypothetical protein